MLWTLSNKYLHIFYQPRLTSWYLYNFKNLIISPLPLYSGTIKQTSSLHAQHHSQKPYYTASKSSHPSHHLHLLHLFCDLILTCSLSILSSLTLSSTSNFSNWFSSKTVSSLNPIITTHVDFNFFLSIYIIKTFKIFFPNPSHLNLSECQPPIPILYSAATLHLNFIHLTYFLPKQLPVSIYILNHLPTKLLPFCCDIYI